MIVTKENFLEFKTHILKSLDKASLVTFDLEMTGINAEEKEQGTDTPIE